MERPRSPSRRAVLPAASAVSATLAIALLGAAAYAGVAQPGSGHPGPAAQGVRRVEQAGSVGDLGTRSVRAACAPGERVVGGGFDAQNADSAYAADVKVAASRPAVVDDGSGREAWEVVAVSLVTGIGDRAVRAYALCAR